MQRVLTAFVPTQRLSLILLTARLSVVPDPGAADTLTGGASVDWFWSSDVLDVLGLTGAEPRNGAL